jgi:DNA-binding NarL/FixJ family response regulator
MAMALEILIVDGHDRVRAALTRRLQRTPGVAVLGAVAAVPAAVELSRKLAPDVVLYEPKTIQGDPMAGLHALLAAGHPVAVWTSSLRRGEPEALLCAGAAAVLLKDTNLAPLLAALTTAVRTQHAVERDASLSPAC